MLSFNFSLILYIHLKKCLNLCARVCACKSIHVTIFEVNALCAKRNQILYFIYYYVLVQVTIATVAASMVGGRRFR